MMSPPLGLQGTEHLEVSPEKRKRRKKKKKRVRTCEYSV
jgi:hypothetical protein